MSGFAHVREARREDQRLANADGGTFLQDPEDGRGGHRDDDHVGHRHHVPQ